MVMVEGRDGHHPTGQFPRRIPASRYPDMPIIDPLIVDDSPGSSEVARELPLADDATTVDGVAATSDQVIDRALRPDVAPTELNLGNESGLDVVNRLAGRPTAGPPVVLIAVENEIGKLLVPTDSGR